MKGISGITRRIDELGRVVVPKEMRESLRIKQGSTLEIYTANGEIVLRKFSALEQLEEFAELVANSIKDNCNFAVLVVDMERIVAKCGKLSSEIVDDELSEQLAKHIEKRKQILLNEQACKNLLASKREIKQLLLTPMLVKGDLIGSILIANMSVTDNISEDLFAMCVLAASIIENQFA